jgi:divalent metal cation (Fe/Co/Zn/Cd) transporter
MNRDFMQRFMTVFGLTVAGLIVIVGFYIVFSQHISALNAWPKEIRTIFGVFIISYGCFRSVIIYQKSKQRRNPNDETEF